MPFQDFAKQIKVKWLMEVRVIIPVITHLSSYSVGKKVKRKINRLTSIPLTSPQHKNGLSLAVKLLLCGFH